MWVETREDRLDIELFPAEVAALGHAVDKRRREFVTGRACARAALRRLGAPVVAIPSGPHGEPLWPPGTVGSITHCRGFRACAVARSGSVRALGIDAEPNEPLPRAVLRDVLHGRERELLDRAPPAGPGVEAVDLARLVFCAKEAVYKAWFPLTGRWLGFEDAEVSVDAAAETFRARLLVPGPVAAFRGRWALEDGIIGAAVAVTTGPPELAHLRPPR